MTHVSKTALFALLLTASAAVADTRYKTDVTFSHTETGVTTVNPSLRVMLDESEGNRRSEFQMQFDYLYTSHPIAVGPVTPPSTLFDFSNSYSLGTNTTVTTLVDRAVMSFTSDQTVFKVGRDALTWGQGTVFNPGDFVAPAAGDSFKPGVDMVYGQYLFDSGADVQLVYVPRPDTVGGAISRDNSTLALRGFTTIGATDIVLTLAEDRGDRVASFGFSGALGVLGVKGEIVAWDLASGSVDPSWVLSATGFGSLGDWSTMYFAELHHNGFGVTPGSAPTAEYFKKLSTGHVYLPAQDYLAVGGNISVSPELSIAPSATISLEGDGALIGLAGNLVLGDNADMSISFTQPTGNGLGLSLPASVSIVATQYF